MCVGVRARLCVLGDKVSGGHGRFNAFAVRPAADSAVDGINRTLLAAAAAAAAAAAIAAGRFYETVERVVGAPNCEWCLRRAGVVYHSVSRCAWYPTRLYASTIRGRQRQPKCVCCVCVRERECVCVCVRVSLCVRACV